MQGGSWGRWVIDAEHGGHTETKDYYISASYFEEDGWRDFSPSEVTQMFAKFGHKDATRVTARAPDPTGAPAGWGFPLGREEFPARPGTSVSLPWKLIP